MAAVVELSYPENVTLVRGAMQNWVDLDVPGPSWSPVARSVIPATAGRRVLVVGPHDPDLVAEIAAEAADVLVVVRGIPDAATIGTRAPGARIHCGNLDDALAGEAGFDVVIALDDVTRVASAEGPDLSWVHLVTRLLTALCDGGDVALAVENERGWHRQRRALDPYLVNRNVNWTPLATWDASRPRTSAQLADWAGSALPDAHRGVLLAEWSAVTVASLAPAGDDLALALAGRPRARGRAASVMMTRSTAMAASLADDASGWLLTTAPVAGQVIASGESVVTTWQADGADGRFRDGAGRNLTVPRHGRTLLVAVTEAALDHDLPAMRSLLNRWRAWVEANAVDARLPGAVSDARLGNVLLADGLEALDPGPDQRKLNETLWDGCSDLLLTLRHQGVPLPWPTAMHPQTMFATLCAMAGVQPPSPDEIGKFMPVPGNVDDDARSGADLAAVVSRQEEQLSMVWQRFHWDERRYATYRAATFSKRAVRFALRKGKGVVGGTGRRSGSLLGRAKRVLKQLAG